MKPGARVLAPLGCALLLTAGCQPSAEEPSIEIPRVADGAPLARMTAEQYNNTVRDLFDPVFIKPIAFPIELEGNGGFQNNAQFNGATSPYVEALQRASLKVGETVMEDREQVFACLDAQGEIACAHEVLPLLAERAWRRPLTEDERITLLADFDTWHDEHGFDVAAQLTIQMLLQAPEFVYFPRFGAGDPVGSGEGVALDGYEMASRLSYFLWNSMPDDELFELAASDSLGDRDVIAEQAWRMLADERARLAVASFHRQLLDLDEVGTTVDLEFYGDALGASSEDDGADFYYLEYLPTLRWEDEVFVTQQIFNGPGTLESLLTSSTVWTSELTAQIAYDTELNDDVEPVLWRTYVEAGILSDEFFEPYIVQEYYPVELDPNQRAGILTHAAFLGAHSGPRHPSPVKRGVHVIDRLLCQTLHPPGDVPPLEESTEGQEPETNRDRYEIHTQNAACASCHETIDGIGFTFEHYDSLGAWRDQDNGHPVDASGQLVGTDVDGPVANAVELSRQLAGSRDVHDCYVQQWFRYAFGRDTNVEDRPTLVALQEGFWVSGGDIPELIVNIAASHEFRHRKEAL